MHGIPLRAALDRLFRCIETYKNIDLFVPRQKKRSVIPPTAIVGHDIAGDVNLLVSEALHCGCSYSSLPRSLTRLICTRMLATSRCAIPLPDHLRHPFPCDILLPPRPKDSDERMVATPFKWPSLQETYNLLVRSKKNDTEDRETFRSDVYIGM